MKLRAITVCVFCLDQKKCCDQSVTSCLQFLYLALILLIIASLFYSGSADRTLNESQTTNQLRYIKFDMHDMHLNATFSHVSLQSTNNLRMVWWCKSTVLMKALILFYNLQGLLRYSYLHCCFPMIMRIKLKKIIFIRA